MAAAVVAVTRRPPGGVSREPDRADPLWTVKELAEFCRVPEATVYAWNHTGDGPTPTPVGKHVRYQPYDVAAWLRQRQQTGRATPSASRRTA